MNGWPTIKDTVEVVAVLGPEMTNKLKSMRNWLERKKCNFYVDISLFFVIVGIPSKVFDFCGCVILKQL